MQAVGKAAPRAGLAEPCSQTGPGHKGLPCGQQVAPQDQNSVELHRWSMQICILTTLATGASLNLSSEDSSPLIFHTLALWIQGKGKNGSKVKLSVTVRGAGWSERR